MRITVDLDNPDNLAIMRCYYNLWHMTKVQPLIRLSASGKGVHIKVHGINAEEIVINSIRLMLNDDEIRVKYDIERAAKPKQVLWTDKGGKKAGKWTTDIDYIISEIGKRRAL